MIHRANVLPLVVALGLLSGCGSDGPKDPRGPAVNDSQDQARDEGGSETTGERLQAPSPPAQGCVDEDDDGWPVCPGVATEFQQDCDDGNPTMFPGNPEIWDELDNDCDGRTDEAEDFDNADRDLEDMANGREIPRDEGRGPARDTWPDGCVDEDGDGWPVCPGVATEFQQDCDDGNPTMFPGNYEIWDELDNDCDGRTDEAEDFDNAEPRGGEPPMPHQPAR